MTIGFSSPNLKMVKLTSKSILERWRMVCGAGLTVGLEHVRQLFCP